MSTREIRTPSAESAAACDVCGRTLLRGERAHPFLQGSEPRTVCELCTARAHQEGWLREGTVPTYEGRNASGDRRRSLLGRLRTRREASPLAGADAGEETLEPARRSPATRPRRRPIEPRHVRAVPSSLEQRKAAAVDAFNGSEHPRKIAGVARSLGLPMVTVWAPENRPSVVNLTVAWELSWYRFEVDLADEQDQVRVGSQGSELAELDATERLPNATCDEQGLVSLAA